MKDSGIDWIGKIPDEWKIEKGKRIFAQRNERGNKINLELLSPTQKYGVIPQTLYEELTTYSAVKLKEGTDLSQLKTVHKGDYCISLRSFQGGFEYSKYEGVVSPAYQIFYAIKNIDECYYKYLFKDQTFIAKMNSFTMSLRDGKNIAFSDFGNTYIPLPPLSEQTKIANFLDKKCAQIDSIIEESKKSIEEYKSWKQSVIFEAVTGKNNRKKWKQEKLKYLADYNIESLSEETNGDFNFDYIDIGSVKFGEGIISKENMNFKVAPSRARRIVKEGDVIISSVRTYLRAIAKIEKSDVPQIVSTGFVVFTPKKEKITSDFLYYAISSENLIEQVESNSVGISYPAINAIDIVNFKIPLPSIKEQEEIVIEIDAKCAQIDSLISEKQSLIKDLAEYKKSLIFEAVTGKRRV